MALLILYASLPCVEGSPWGNVNGLTVEGHERTKEQQKQFTTLLKSFVKLVGEVYDERTLIAFELSKNCKYWRWPMVRKFHVRAPFWWMYDGSSRKQRSAHEEKLDHCWKLQRTFQNLIPTVVTVCMSMIKVEGKHWNLLKIIPSSWPTCFMNASG